MVRKDSSIEKYWDNNECLRLYSGPEMAKTRKRSNVILDVDPTIYLREPGLSMIFYKTQFPGAREKVTEISYAKARMKYGEELPLKISERLKTEMEIIDSLQGWSCLYFAYIMANRGRYLGYPQGDGCCDSLLVAYLLGITDVNPLPPHYYCPKCKTIKWVDADRIRSGYDLMQFNKPGRYCADCSGELEGDGHNIPVDASVIQNPQCRMSVYLNMPKAAIKEILLCLDKLMDRKDMVKDGFSLEQKKEDPVAFLYICDNGIVSALHKMETISGISAAEIKPYEIDLSRFFREKDYKGLKKIYRISNNNHRISGHFLWKVADSLEIEKFSDLAGLFSASTGVFARVLGNSGAVSLKLGQDDIADAIVLMKLIWYKLNRPKAFRKAVRMRRRTR